MFFVRSLKAKLILLNVTLVSFMTAGSAIMLVKMVRDEEKILNSALTERASIYNNAIQDQFFERYGDVKAFAAALAEMPTASRATRTDLLNQYVGLYGIYDIILFVDKNGDLLAVNDRDLAGNAIDISGVAAQNFAKTPWFEKAKAGVFNEDRAKGFTGVVVEQPAFDGLVESIYKKPAYGNGFTAPVVTSKGEILGYLTTRAGFRWVEDLVKRFYTDLKKSGYDSSGFMLYGDNGQVYINYLPSKNNNSLDFSRDKVAMQNLNLSQFEEMTAKGLAPGKTGMAYFNEKDTQKMRHVAFAAISGPKVVDGLWNFAVHYEEAEAHEALNQLKQLFYIMIIASSGAALILGVLFGNRLSKTLQSLVERLYKQGSEVKVASEQVSVTSEQLSSSASQQAAALQQTVAAVNEISAMVGRTADMAQQSRNTSQNSRNVANEGKRTVDEMIQSMEQIRESNKDILTQVEDGNREISQIVKVISEIGNKTKVINDIVFQTKLLSFNASVEAARAGEHGKGFAVVAEEVGNLAQMSGQAAKEISELLEQSVVKVQSIVDQTGQRVEKLIVSAREKVANGEETARRCVNILEQILMNADEVNSLISEIATSAQEQARGVQEINSAMTELDTVTQQNSLAASQSSQLSGSLLVQSETLSGLVEILNGVVSGALVSPGVDAARYEQGAPSAVTVRLESERHKGKIVSLKSSLPKISRGKKQPQRDEPAVERAPVHVQGNTALKDPAIPDRNDPRFLD